MHGGLTLGGPVWLLATVLILTTLVLALFVMVDALRPARRAAAVGRVREPLWVYAAGEGLYIVALAATQVLPGVSIVSALPVVALPFALTMSVVYLLRVVYPKAPAQ